MSKFDELKKTLGEEDATIFTRLDEQGWALEREPGGYSWHHYDLNELHGPCVDDEEIVRYARTINEQNAAATIRDDAPSTAAARHEASADEVDLRDDLFKLLSSLGAEPRMNVTSESGTADVVTRFAIYITWCLLDFGKLKVAVDEIDAIRREINPDAHAVIVTRSADENDLQQFQAYASSYRVEVAEWDESNPLFNLSSEDSAKADSAESFFHVESLFSGDAQTQPSPLLQQMHPSRLTRHPALLMRAGGLNEEHVEELKDAYLSGRHLPPLDVFYDGERYFVAEGNHRHEAASRAGVLVDVTIHEGVLRDARIFALGANVDHGLKLTNEDKRYKAVMMLADPDLFIESDSLLSKIAGGLTQQFLSEVRRHLAKLIPVLQAEVAPERGDATIATTLEIPVGLVRVVRNLLPSDYELLTKNILRDDGRRRGADGIIRSLPEKAETLEAEKAPLFPADGAASDESEAAPQNVTDDETAPAEADTQATEISVTDRRRIHLEHEPDTATRETAADVTDEAVSPEVADVSTSPEKTPSAPQDAEEVPTFEAQFSASMKTAGWVLKREGKRVFAHNERLQLMSPLRDRAQDAIDEAARMQDRHDEKEKAKARPSVEELLKGRDLRVTYILMGEMPGSVTVQVYVGEDIEDMLMEVHGLARLRPFPEPVQEMIAKQAAKHVRGKSSSKKQATSTKAPTASGGNGKQKAAPKVERIVTGIKEAKDIAALDKLIDHYKLNNLSEVNARFTEKDAKLIRNTLSAQRGRLSKAGRATNTTAKSSSSTKKKAATARR
ncbi:MAG TPA: hypothetical protein VF708_19795 [Pyrinomonadaceae bacterium]|jgi:hypothetical protein